MDKKGKKLFAFIAVAAIAIGGLVFGLSKKSDSKVFYLKEKDANIPAIEVSNIELAEVLDLYLEYGENNTLWILDKGSETQYMVVDEAGENIEILVTELSYDVESELTPMSLIEDAEITNQYTIDIETGDAVGLFD